MIMLPLHTASYILTIPPELLIEVLSYLECKDLLNTGLVSPPVAVASVSNSL